VTIAATSASRAAPTPTLRTRIKRIEPIAVSLPMAKPMKMAGVEIANADNVLVRIETDSGQVGWGEAASAPMMTGETMESMAVAVRYMAPALTGCALAGIEQAGALMDRAMYGNNAAKAAVEMAWHDALGKVTAQPVYELLGGKRRDRVPALWMLGTGNADADVEEATQKIAAGYVAFKIKVGGNAPGEDAARTRRICAALGGGKLISADANQGWTVAQASAYVRAVADTTLDFLEQPVRGEDLMGMAAVAAASRVPIGFDEGAHSVADIARHHAARAAGGGSLKAIKLGGLRPVQQAAVLCDSLNMKVNLACKVAESSIGTAAVLHLAAAIPALDWGVSLTSQYLAEDIVYLPLSFVRGHAAVPTGVGLGIDVDEARVRRYRRKV
jgi:L-alanine-DL-glutamate epimerase-like enolase superfamily enzyme